MILQNSAAGNKLLPCGPVALQWIKLRPYRGKNRNAKKIKAVSSGENMSHVTARLGFIGSGMMAEALARGFIQAGVASSSQMCATDISLERREVTSTMITRSPATYRSFPGFRESRCFCGEPNYIPSNFTSPPTSQR